MRCAIIAAAPPAEGRQWMANLGYPKDAVGRLMEPPQAVFPPELTVAQTVERIRELVKPVFVTDGFVTDPQGVLLGSSASVPADARPHDRQPVGSALVRCGGLRYRFPAGTRVLSSSNQF